MKCRILLGPERGHCQKHGFWHIPLQMNSHAGLALDASGGGAGASLREKPELEYQNGIEGALRMITIRDLDVRLLMDSCTRLTLDATRRAPRGASLREEPKIQWRTAIEGGQT